MNAREWRQYQVAMRLDLGTFAQRCFLHLNPGEVFMPGWHIQLVSEWMDRCLYPGQRIIINLPPRHLKSLLGSVALPAWLLGHNPSMKIICASYGAELSNKLSRDCRSVMDSPWYRKLFPGTVLDRLAVNELTTTKQGSRLATSVDGVITGRGADLIIIDDPIKPDEALSDAIRAKVNEWFRTTMYSRLNHKVDGSFLVIMQRLHEDDLTGSLLATEEWRSLVLPAIAEVDLKTEIETRFGLCRIDWKVGEALHPEREPLETLHQTRRTIGEYNFASQYQQAPAPRGGGMVKLGWFGRYRPADLPPKFDMVLQSWDTANKPSELADYSVCTTWGTLGNRIYLLNVLRQKLDYPDLKRAVRQQAALYPKAVVLIEDKASGTQLIQELSRDGMPSVRRYTPEGGSNKQMRMHAQTGIIENSLVFVPETAEWLDAYLHEMTIFPAGKHDDQVDSTSQALHWLLTARKEPGLLTYYRWLEEKERNGAPL